MANELAQIAEDSARSGVFLILGTALATVIMAIASILIARFLGPGYYGQYTLALVVPELFFVVTDIGINRGIIKFTTSLRAKGENARLRGLIKYGLLLKASTGLAIFIVTYVLADLFASGLFQRPELAFYIRVASTLVIFQSIFTTVNSVFVGLDRTEYSAATSSIQAAAKAIVSTALVLLGFGIAGALVGYLAGYIVAAGVGTLVIFIMLHEKQRTGESASFRRDLGALVQYSAPLYISSLLLTGFVPLYQSLMLAVFTTDADIGNYKAAINLTTMIAVLSIPITTALLPAFSKLDSSAVQKTKAFFKLANKYTALLTAPVMLLVIIFSGEIVQVVYGARYESAPLFLATYSLLYFLVGIGFLIFTGFYIGLGDTRTFLAISLITFFTLAMLSPILASAYGVLGLIVAFLAASASGTLYALYVARTKFGIEFDTRSVIKIYLISIFSGIPSVALLRLSTLPVLFNLIGGALLYLFIYMTLIPLSGVIRHSELQSAAYILQKVKPLAPITKLLLKYQEKVLAWRETKKPFI